MELKNNENKIPKWEPTNLYKGGLVLRGEKTRKTTPLGKGVLGTRGVSALL